jgi:hypothetical protein
MNEGYIKLHRSILDWEWYKDTDVFCVYIHLLLLAMKKSVCFDDTVVERGQVITRYTSIANGVGIKPEKVRDAMKKLRRGKYLTVQPWDMYYLITISNYESVVDGEPCFPPESERRIGREETAPGYSKWRRAVLNRDGYRCQDCGSRDDPVCAHHIMPFSTHPNLRLLTGNGITLCKKCHKERHRMERENAGN